MFLFKNSPYATLVPCSLTVSKYANIAFLMVIFILLLWFNWKTTDDVSTYHIQQWSYWIDIYTRSRWHRNKYVWTAIRTMLMSSLKAQLRENQIRGQRGTLLPKKNRTSEVCWILEMRWGEEQGQENGLWSLQLHRNHSSLGSKSALRVLALRLPHCPPGCSPRCPPLLAAWGQDCSAAPSAAGCQPAL